MSYGYGLDKNGFVIMNMSENNYYPFGMKHQNYNMTQLEYQDVGGVVTPYTSLNPFYKYKYNGKELQDELGLNVYDYGYRHYMPDIGRMGNVDMLAELAYDLSPNRYCFNNPVRFIDPNGLWETTAAGYTTNKSEDIARFMSYLDVENNGLNNVPTTDQASTFIEGEMSSGGHGLLSDGSILADEFSITTYKQIGGGIEGYADKDSYSNFWHGVQKSMTPDGLDTRTLEKNLLGLTYPGGNNPKTYRGNDDYSYKPTRIEEYPGVFHDWKYDKLGVKGAGGLFSAKSAISADWQFVNQELTIAIFSTNLKTKFNAAILGIGLGAAATPKTIWSNIYDSVRLGNSLGRVQN